MRLMVSLRLEVSDASGLNPTHFNQIKQAFILFMREKRFFTLPV